MRCMSDVSAFRDMRMVAAFVAVQKSEGVADDIRFSSDLSSEVGGGPTWWICVCRRAVRGPGIGNIEYQWGTIEAS